MLQNVPLNCVTEGLTILTALRRDSLAALEAAKGGTQKFLERAQESHRNFEKIWENDKLC